MHACMIHSNQKRLLKLLGIKKVWVGVMGCICSKGGQQPNNGNYVDSNHNHSGGKSKEKSKKSSKRSKRDQDVDNDDDYENVCAVIEQCGGGGNFDGEAGGLGIFPLTPNDHEETKKGGSSRSNHHFHHKMSSSSAAAAGVSSMAHGGKAAQVVAGWPSWLTAVAGEAINGWIPRRLDSFEKLEKIGQGTYSSVYKARDLESTKIVALKKVRFANMDPESVRFMAREIIILRRLDHPNVMKLEGIITSRTSGSLYLVFEYMDHDLTGLLSSSGSQFTESQIKCYMKQLLTGLAHCHSRGIMHRDIKGANLLIDSKGILKIADFGLATFCTPSAKPTSNSDNNKPQPLTSRVVTLWYRPPELLLGSTDYGVEVDLWSSGCILAELFNGKPIMPGRTEVEQIHKIFKLCGSPSEEYWKTSKLRHSTTFKPQQPYKRRIGETFGELLPSSALGLVEVLLSVEPENRGTTASALASEFFTTEPLPCEPSSLPKYPPSKEFDVKLREDDNKRKRAAGGKGKGRESERIFTRGAKVMAATNSNIDVHISAKRRKERDRKEKATKDNNERSKNNKEDDCDDEADSNTMSATRNNATSRDLNLSSQGGDQGVGGGRNSNQTSSSAAAKLSRFSNSVVIRDNNASSSSSQYPGYGGGGSSSHWQQLRFGRHNLEDASAHPILGESKFGHKGERSSVDSARGFYGKKGRMHYSGPLMTAGGNIEEMLKEHERRIQHAVRKARSGKNKNFQAGDDGEDGGGGGDDDGSQLYRAR
ncbi:unnamed protein product [Linum trigynum]|uniref:Protein kinase domain-containing protein n=2 Tax=Linum trigynum TaxID=586398 RepID=A0AAV2EGU8_9ROSI